MVLVSLWMSEGLFRKVSAAGGKAKGSFLASIFRNNPLETARDSDREKIQVLEGLDHMSFHAMFYTVGENDGNRNKRSGAVKIQPLTVWVDCVHPKAALVSGTILRGCRSCRAWGLPRELQRQVSLSLTNLPFPCLCFRAESVASAATPHLCLMCNGDGQVSSKDVEGVFSKDRKV